MSDLEEKILRTTVTLMSKKGYRSVTTKEIAKESSVSEMTLFRYFNTKENLLKTAIERHYYSHYMNELFEERIAYDLYKDLTLICQTYQELMLKNKEVTKISIKEGENIPDLAEQISKHPLRLKTLLIKYFDEMRERGKISYSESSEHLAVVLIWANFGSFTSRVFTGENKVTSMTQDEFIETIVQLFTRSLIT